MHEDGGKGSNLKESSPPRPNAGGVEKELPTLFQRLERYPIWELDMELDREPSWDSWERAGSMRLGVMSGSRGVLSWRLEMGVLFTRSEWERGMEGVRVRVRGEAEMGSVTRELAGSDAGKVFSGLLGVVFVIGSEEMTCMAPYRRAATS